MSRFTLPSSTAEVSRYNIGKYSYSQGSRSDPSAQQTDLFLPSTCLLQPALSYTHHSKLILASIPGTQTAREHSSSRACSPMNNYLCQMRIAPFPIKQGSLLYDYELNKRFSSNLVGALGTPLTFDAKIHSRPVPSSMQSSSEKLQRPERETGKKKRSSSTWKCTDGHSTSTPFMPSSQLKSSPCASKMRAPNLQVPSKSLLSPHNVVPLRQCRSNHITQTSGKFESIRDSCLPRSPWDSTETWSHLVFQDKEWCEIGLAVYKVGVGMYHSSLVVDAIEFHFWESYGVEPRRRYFNDDYGNFVSIDHLPFVGVIEIATLMLPPRRIALVCAELAAAKFSKRSYDLIKCNCNHFTLEVLRRLGLQSKMPSWINRLATTADSVCTKLPFVRNWINRFLSRRSVSINQTLPIDVEENIEQEKQNNDSTRRQTNSNASTAVSSIEQFY